MLPVLDPNLFEQNKLDCESKLLMNECGVVP
jgi:hypothetical protein